MNIIWYGNGVHTRIQKWNINPLQNKRVLKMCQRLFLCGNCSGHYNTELNCEDMYRIASRRWHCENVPLMLKFTPFYKARAHSAYKILPHILSPIFIRKRGEIFMQNPRSNPAMHVPVMTKWTAQTPLKTANEFTSRCPWLLGKIQSEKQKNTTLQQFQNPIEIS